MSSHAIQKRKVDLTRIVATICLLGVSAAGVLPQSSGSSSLAPAEPQAVSAPVRQQGNLDPGKPVERELKGGETDVYTIKLKRGQFLHVIAEQKGIDVALKLVGPDGKSIASMDSPNGTIGLEQISTVAESSGAYKLEIASGDKNAPLGRYRASIGTPRRPTEADHARISAERAFSEAAQLQGGGSAVSIRAALQKYEVALPLWQAAGDRYEEAWTQLAVGGIFFVLGEKQKALECFSQGLLLAHANGDQSGEAAALNSIGVVQYTLGEKQKALDTYGRALLLLRAAGDRPGEAMTLTNIGLVYNTFGEKQKALDYYNQALRLARVLGSRSAEAQALDNFGLIYDSLGEKQKALEYLNQALSLHRAVGNPYGEAETLSNLGNVYNSLGKIQNALDYYNQAIRLDRAIGDRASEAKALHNIGKCYDDLGEAQKALDYYNQALPLHHAVRERFAEAETLNNIATVYSNLGEKQKALEYLRQALTLHREMGNRTWEATALVNIGSVYFTLGEKQKALDYYNEALPLERAVGNRSGEAATLGNIGSVNSNLGENQKALEYFNEALRIAREVQDRSLEATMLDHVGRAYYGLGEKQKALDYFNQSVRLAQEVGDRSGEATALNSIGSAYHALGDRQRSLEHYHRALSLFLAVQNPLSAAGVLTNLMITWHEIGEPETAIFFGKQAINGYQEIRSNIRGLEKDTQRSFLESQEKTYRELADLLITESRLTEAQEVLDLLKEQEYFDFIRGPQHSAERPRKPLSLNPTEQKSYDEYRKIEDEVTALGGEWSELRAKPSRTPEEETRLAKLGEKLTVANQEMDRFFKRLYVEFGRDVQANQSVKNVREETSGLQSLVRELGTGTVALYTLVGDSRYRVIVITASTVQAREYPITAPNLRRKVAALLEALRNPNSDALPASQDLYKILIAPIAGDLKGAKAETLMWSLNDVLRYVPMPALHDGQQFLVEKYRNVVITSSSMGRLKDAVNVRGSNGVGMGVSKNYDGLGPLPAVPKELNDIIQDEATPGAAGVLPGTVMLDDDFTEKHMTSALQKHYHVVHIASHFVLRPGNEANSYLLLGGKDVGGDGYHLTLAELHDNPALTFEGIELLTLSGCETGTSSSDADGREVDGLGFTAQQKGAKAVMASLWDVPDASTGILMADFYRRWINTPGITKAEAMRQAQRSLLHGATTKTAESQGAKKATTELQGDSSSRYAHPYYWAPFILIGNWN